MGERSELVSFRIFGQEFRLRAAPEDRERIERVAAAVDERMREHKRRASSDLRAALMTAYELCFERDELAPVAGDGSAEPELALAAVNNALDRLLAKIDKETNIL